MKKYSTFNLFFVIILFSIFSGFSLVDKKGLLEIKFTNLEKKDGFIEVSIYASKSDFLKKGKALKKQRISVDANGDAVALFNELPFGTYAAVGYHDLNSNGKFDRNFLGLPKEPYAFSKEYSIKTRKPKFKEVNFKIAKQKCFLEMGFQKF